MEEDSVSMAPTASCPTVYCCGSIMEKPCALLLLLAVAANRVHLSRSVVLFDSEETDITACPITFLGREYTLLHFTASPSLSICFKNNQSDPEEDCLRVADNGAAGFASVDAKFNQENPFVGNIVGTSSCSIFVEIKINSWTYYMDFELYNFNKQAAVQLTIYGFTGDLMNITAEINNTAVKSWTFDSVERQNTIYLDISGCRLSDDPFVIDSTYEEIHPENCSKTICLPSAVLGPVSTCGDTEFCHGDNLCLPAPSMCTVTGSTVIDFFYRVHEIPDRCVYTLLEPVESYDFELLAGFRERRLENVTFLDFLIIKLKDSDTFFLEQGGRVTVNDQILTLNATAQVFHNLELWKDETGVSAKIPFTNITVYFDGYTAQVTAYDETVKGLCGNLSDPDQNTTISSKKSFDYSADGCDVEYPSTDDSAVNCTWGTEHCGLLMQAPFTDCHSYTKPEPYITACTNILCNYPAVDDLHCQLLEAYAKTCSLKRLIPFEDWRTTVGCSASPQAFCQDKHCLHHEVCGEVLSENRCICRAIFASGYRENDTFGQQTTCKENSASITLVGCLLEEIDVDSSSLHLNDQNCTGSMNSQTGMLTFSYDSSNTCGTKVERNNNQVIFQNTILRRNSSTNDNITRQSQFVIDFSCSYMEPDVETVGFRIKDSSVVQQIESGFWNYTLMMNAYTDYYRMNLIDPNTEIELNQKIWVQLKTEGLDNSMVVLVTDSCWATNQPSPDDTLKHSLIKGGCPDDETVMMEGNGKGTSNFFSFNMFEFARKNNEVYLHCKLELCPKQSNSCAPNCGGGGRRRRSFRHADEHSALITMVWSK